MQQVIDFNIHLRTIQLFNHSSFPLNLTFTLMKGMRKCGQTHCEILQKQNEPYDVSSSSDMMFKYIYDEKELDDMNVQLIITDTDTHRQIDSLTLSAIQLLNECQKSQSHVNYHWKIPDQMDISYEITMNINQKQQQPGFIRISYSPEKSDNVPAITLRLQASYQSRSKEIKKRQSPTNQAEDILRLTKYFSVDSREDEQNNQQQQQPKSLLLEKKSRHRKSRQLDKSNHQSKQHHGHHHESSHDHQHHGLSKKLKLVIVMLIFGLIFMVYHLATTKSKNHRKAFKSLHSSSLKDKKGKKKH